jgi:hypothetical protein
VDIKVLDSEGKDINEQEVKSIETPEGIQPDGVMLREQIAKNLFDFKPSETATYKDKLDVLLQYAKLKTDDHSPAGISWALRSLGHKLGTPPLGEKLINYLHVYAKLYLESKRIEAEKDKFLRGEKDE